MAASASYSAVPSMLMVAPTGSTKRVMRLSIRLFSSRHLKVTGSVAELRGAGSTVLCVCGNSDSVTGPLVLWSHDQFKLYQRPQLEAGVPVVMG
ncbi:hypothetical protein EYF80_037836 [Liparis tanakae]|uniref:Uncharacterized protein n=1 Tax=Liparis tanakae TaxID=230148 RepID=A0A4Z2GEX1_9TELE|nr:hypothetical protein EYF80_037836 [Liparis tanakae]